MSSFTTLIDGANVGLPPGWADMVVKPLGPQVMRRRTLRPVRHTWHGLFVYREWDAAFTEADYLHLLAGSKRKLARPDAYARDGHPIWRHSEATTRRIERDLDKTCRSQVATSLVVPTRAGRILDAPSHTPRIVRARNAACNVGLTAILNYLANTAGYTGINYLAVGTGAGTPATTDTQLFTELFRKTLTSSTISGTQITESVFFATTEANGTLTEAGLFGNGATATANSGTLFNHSIMNYNKNTSSGLTVNAIITFTAS